MKNYLNLDGLSHFFNKLINKFATKEELDAIEDDVITNAEINDICRMSSSINEFIDRATGITYNLYVDNGELKMAEIGNVAVSTFSEVTIDHSNNYSKLTDITTNKTYYLYVDNGKLYMAEVE